MKKTLHDVLTEQASSWMDRMSDQETSKEHKEIEAAQKKNKPAPGFETQQSQEGKTSESLYHQNITKETDIKKFLSKATELSQKHQNKVHLVVMADGFVVGAYPLNNLDDGAQNPKGDEEGTISYNSLAANLSKFEKIEAHVVLGNFVAAYRAIQNVPVPIPTNNGDKIG